MSRLMSVAFTEQAVLERRKTVTRRKGWWTDKNGRRLLVEGDHLTLCRKVMGRKMGEPLVRLVDVEVVNVSRLELGLVRVPGELTAEGFPELERWPGSYQGAQEFISRYFEPQGLGWSDEVTRIEWRYLEVHAAPPVGEGQMPCCRRPVLEAAPWHRLTYDEAAVTCPGPLPVPAELQEVAR